MIVSGIEISMRLNAEDQARIVEALQNGAGLGETVELRITDNRNRFDLGSFTARIEKWTPKER